MLSEFQPGLYACGLMVKFRATSVEGTVLCSMVLSAGRNDSDWVSFRMPGSPAPSRPLQTSSSKSNCRADRRNLG